MSAASDSPAGLRHLVLGAPLDWSPPGAEAAHLAMGCFWGAEALFWRLPGVLVTAVGYQGGTTPAPDYRQVCSGTSGHAETVRVVFDPEQIGYADLLRVFWENHDPTQLDRQGADVGSQYRSALFPADARQREIAEGSRDAFAPRLAAAGLGAIVTRLEPFGEFHYAEAHHQQYLARNPDGYCPVHATGVRCG